jgi:hypothetical protein
MYYETCVIRWNAFGEKIIASEACGGVVETNMATGKDQYLTMTLRGYLMSMLCSIGTIEICYYPNP